MAERSQGLESTALWRTYREKMSSDEERMAWVKKVYEEAVAYLSDVRQDFKNYTLHDGTHVRNVLDAMGGLLAIHNLAVLTIPCAVWVAVLAEPIVKMLFTGDQDTAVKLLQTGSGVIVFFTFGYFLMLLMQRIRKIRMVILGGLAAFLIHLIFLFVLISSTKLGIIAVALGLLVFWLVVCITGFIGIVQYMQYSPEWLRTFGVTTAAAAVSGLVGMLLSKVMISWAGGIITFFVCIVVCMLIYLVLMILLRGIREDELEDMPGGRVIIVLAERMHLL